MSDSLECPRCGTVIDDRGESSLPQCPTCQFQLETAQVVQQLGLDADYQITAPPYESKAEILEATNDRLMLSIPAGGKRANSLGCFGVIWLLISGAVTTAFGFAKLNG